MDFQGAGHPDANLLAAFVEKTLTEKERTQVLNHLSQCADCREVAAFTLPAEVAAAEPARGGSRAALESLARSPLGRDGSGVGSSGRRRGLAPRHVERARRRFRK